MDKDMSFELLNTIIIGNILNAFYSLLILKKVDIDKLTEEDEHEILDKVIRTHKWIESELQRSKNLIYGPIPK